MGAKALGVGFLLLCGYYGRFYLLRHEAMTLVQATVLAIAGILLVLQKRPMMVQTVWFRGWRPVAWQAWVALGVWLAITVGIFLALDAGSHSASDTLTRALPTLGLLAALLVKIHAERSEWRATEAR